MTTSNTTEYAPCSRDEIPDSTRWDVPRANQGQIVEVAFANASPRERSEACNGDMYKRVTDRSDNSVRYYCRVQWCYIIVNDVTPNRATVVAVYMIGADADTHMERVGGAHHSILVRPITQRPAVGDRIWL